MNLITFKHEFLINEWWALGTIAFALQLAFSVYFPLGEYIQVLSDTAMRYPNVFVSNLLRMQS